MLLQKYPSNRIGCINKATATMSAKSLGTLAKIYAIVELQTPLSRKTMLCKGDVNNPVGSNDAFLHS